MLRLVLKLVALVALLAIGAGVAIGYWAHRSLQRPYAAWQGNTTSLVLEPGMSAGRMLDRLSEAGVIDDPRLVRAWLSWTGDGASLRAGEYLFERPASPIEVLERLKRGDVLLHTVTVPEGFNLQEIAARFAAAGFGSQEELVAAFSDPSLVRDLDPDAQDLEGYLFPDTYNFPRGQRPAGVAAAMVRRFRAELTEDDLAQAERLGLGVRGAVTLASLIEKETSVPEERGHISRVFHNRLARGMKLECDPTVIYALHRAGKEVGKLTYAHLRFESPWNTYHVAGLPEGPIANPGGDSLRAAIRPDDGNDLFFVAAPGGGHKFSRNLKGHLEAVAEWRRYVRSSR